MKSGTSAPEFLEKEPVGLARGIEMRNLTKVFSTGKGVLKILQMAMLCTAFLFFFLSMGPRDYQIYQYQSNNCNQSQQVQTVQDRPHS